MPPKLQRKLRDQVVVAAPREGVGEDKEKAEQELAQHELHAEVFLAVITGDCLL